MNEHSYQLELLGVFKSIPDEKKGAFIGRFSSQAKNPTAVFGWSCFLGWLGIDRFVLGQPLLGFLKLITFGGLYIWYIIDLFLVAGEARKMNVDTAREISNSI